MGAEYSLGKIFHCSFGSNMSCCPLAAYKKIMINLKLAGFMLADEGYDVWLANARGTEPSRTHVRLSASGWSQKTYWSFE